MIFLTTESGVGILNLVSMRYLYYIIFSVTIYTTAIDVLF